MENQITKRKCSQKEEDEHNHKHGFDNFPHEITHNILSRLPITSFIQFGFVRKSWLTLAHDPHLANMHFNQTGKNNSYLLFHRETPIQNQLYFVEFSGDQQDNGIVRKFEIPFSISMPEFKVIGSCNGLLCLSYSSYKDPLYICNPFTRKFKELPKSNCFQNKPALFGFGFHSTTNDYKVVRIVYYYRTLPVNLNSPESEVEIYSFSDETWRSIGGLQYELEKNYWSENVLVGGRLHWVSRHTYNGPGRVIVSFDLADEKFYEMSNPDMVEENCTYHLTDLGGCLSALVYGGRVRRKFEIWVMKDYGNKDSWVKEYDILLNVLCVDGIGFRISGSQIRVLGLTKNGEILLEYNMRRLVLYDAVGCKLTDVMFNGTRKPFRTVQPFRTIVHYGTLNWIDSPLKIETYMTKMSYC